MPVLLADDSPGAVGCGVIQRSRGPRVWHAAAAAWRLNCAGLPALRVAARRLAVTLGAGVWLVLPAAAAEGFLDALGVGGSDALVDRQCLP